jgi:ankyrin repeat protein
MSKNLCLAAALGLLLAACAQAPDKPEASAPAAAAPGLSPAERASIFVNSARNGQIDEVRKALDAGQPVDAVDSLGQSALLAAISHDNLEEVKLLLAHGADPNFHDDAGWTSLHYAAYFGSEVVILGELLDRKANINAVNDRGITALYLASATGHEHQVKLLLVSGADRSIASNTGYTALRVAKVRGFADVVALLDPDAAKQATGTAKQPAATP